jgi:hypothetical protein
VPDRRIRLVHPALVFGIAAEFVGVDVAAVFVEVNVSVLLAHVDLELACGTAALPTVVIIAYAEVALAEPEDEAATRGESSVEITHERAAQLGESAEAVVAFEQDSDADEDIDGDQVLRLHSDKEVETNLLVAGDDCECDQERKDGCPGAKRD